MPVVPCEAQHHLDEVDIRHRHAVGACHCYALVHEQMYGFAGLWNCDDIAIWRLYHGGDGIEGRIDDQLGPEIDVDMWRNATRNVCGLEPVRHAGDCRVTWR